MEDRMDMMPGDRRDEGIEAGHAAGIREGIETGRAAGMREGIETGRTAGVREGIRTMVRKLAKQNIPIQQIAEAAGVGEATVRAWIEEKTEE